MHSILTSVSATLTAAVPALSTCGWHATCHLRKWQSKWLLSSCNPRHEMQLELHAYLTELLLHYLHVIQCDLRLLCLWHFCGTDAPRFSFPP